MERRDPIGTAARGPGSPVRRWHRYAGLLASIPVALVAITGILLSHSSQLGLGSRFVGFAPVLAWYGLETAPEVTAFEAGEHWVSCVGERAFFDRRPLAEVSDCPVGALASGGMLVAVTPREVILLSPEGQLIERLGNAAGAPVGSSAAGVLADGSVVVESADGLRVADRELLEWRPLDESEDVVWSRPVAAPSELRRELVRAYRRQWLSVERLLQDLHSGRLFGRWGVLVMDAAALLLLSLVLSGWRLWRRGAGARPRDA